MKLLFGKLYLGGIAGRFVYVKPREKNPTKQPTGVRPWFDRMLPSAVILEPGISALRVLAVLRLIVWSVV